MNLRPCPDCQNEMSVTAKRCPHCGARNDGLIAHPLLTGVILIASGLFLWYVLRLAGV
jgi:hypothetical protein